MRIMERTWAWTIGMIVLGLAVTVNTVAARPAMEDQAIADAIEDELTIDPAVPGYRIDVGSTDGVVTLTGQVENLLAKQRALRLAETVRGVETVVNRIDVEPSPQVTDAELLKDVRGALRWDAATDAYEVEASVNDGAVTLSGLVDSWQEKELCEKVAAGVDGVTEIKNTLTVNYKLSRTDDEIRPEVEKSLRWDALIDDALVNVQVEDSVVTLSGIVGSAAEKSRAIHTAWVAGVRDVKSEDLEVKRWARDDDLRKGKYATKSDADVAQAIKDGMLYDPRVVSFKVSVEVDDGVATLRGTVDNVKAQQAAAANARNTVGVWRVKNRIKVRPEDTPSDSTLRERVKAALKRNPYADDDQVSMVVNDGVVHLHGTVDSHFQEAQINGAIERVQGVLAVRSYLTVTDIAPYAYNPYVDDWYVYDYDWYRYEPAPTMTSDRQIKQDIADQLWWSPYVDSDEVRVSVDDGVATLSGTVDTWSERQSARENAFEGGAIWVINDLDVQ